MSQTLLETVTLGLAQRRLRARHEGKRWRALAERFPDVLASMDGMDLGPWVTPLWEGFNAKMQASLEPVPPMRFLRESVIRQSMFVDVRGEWLNAQMELLSGHFGAERLSELVAESPVGDPPLCDATLMTSHNTVHHLAHLARYEQQTGSQLAACSTVLEWGGGYGNLCRLVHKMSPDIERYVIVDTPLFGALQWLYLSMTLGEDRVSLWTGKGEPPAKGVVIVPVPEVPELDVSVDLLLSTWAISECSPYAQDYVSGARDWFGAERLLLAFQASNAQLPEAGRLDGIARNAGCEVLPLGVIDDNFYAFR